MTAPDVWQFLHVACMFLAVSIFVGQGMVVGVVARSGDVRALRRVLATEERFEPVGGALFVLGVVFGFLTGIVGDYDLTQIWLVIGYVLAALILVLGIAYHGPAGKKLRALAQSSPEDQPSEELRVAANAPIGRAMNIVDAALWLGVIFVMVVKPFG
jgi:hypothetical protein